MQTQIISKFFYHVLVLLIVVSCAVNASQPLTKSKNLPNLSKLLDAIEQQDVKTLKRELKGRSFTHQEEYELIVKARQYVKEHDQKAWFSSDSRKSCLAVGCLVLAGVGFACLGNALLPLGLIYDTKPGHEVSFFKELSRELDHPGVKRYLALNLMAGLACIASGILSGHECITGYFTERPRNILYLVNQHVTPYSVIISGEEEFIYFNPNAIQVIINCSAK